MFSATPAIVSTFPAMPDGALGVLAGSATVWPESEYRFHLTPNIFWAFLMLIVASDRRWVTSILAVTPYCLNALMTPLRLDDDAPYLLWSVDIDRYLP